MKAKPKLSDLNAHLLCPLCKGYFVDASTLSDCLHSFCRSCLLRHLVKDRHCPKCGVEVKLHDTTTPPFHSDNALQDVVYKLLPSVYKDELKRRGDFYRQYCERKKKGEGSSGRVQLFDKHLVELAAYICTPDENISLAIEYVAHPFKLETADMSSSNTSSKRKRPNKDKCDKTLTFKRFFRCPAAVTVGILKKLLRYKLELTGNFEIELLSENMSEPLDDSISLMDVAYIYSWRRNAPMQLYFALCKADIREEDNAPELEQMPQLTREASPLKSEPPPLTDADEPPSKAPNVPTFTVALNSLNTKLFDMSQTPSAHPPIITTSTPAAGAAAPSPSTPAGGRRQKRKPSSPSKKTKNPSPTIDGQFAPSNGALTSNGLIRPDSKSGSKLSSESTSSTPSPVPPLQRMTGAPPTAKAPVSSAMMKAALENAKRTCYNFTGQSPPELKKQKISPLAAKPPSHPTTTIVNGPSVVVSAHSNGNNGATTSDAAKNATLKSMLNRPPPPMLSAQTTASDGFPMNKNGGVLSGTCCSSTPVTFTSPTSLPPSLLSIGHDSLTLPLAGGGAAPPSSRSSAPPLTAVLNNNVFANSASPTNLPPPPPLLSVNSSKSMPVVTTTFGLVVVSDPQALLRSTNTGSSSTSGVPLVSR